MRNIQHVFHEFLHRNREGTERLWRMILLVGTLIMILLCTFAVSMTAGAKHTQAAQRSTQTTYESVRISGGDSLWSIAQEYCEVENTADFVEELKMLNSLSSDRIQTGSYLLVPVTYVR